VRRNCHANFFLVSHSEATNFYLLKLLNNNYYNYIVLDYCHIIIVIFIIVVHAISDCLSDLFILSIIVIILITIIQTVFLCLFITIINITTVFTILL
jgi:hypothetical protein